MPISTLNFPILSPEQANPLGYGLSKGQQILAQALENKFTPELMRQKILAESIANQYAPALNEANIAEKMALAQYYPGLIGIQQGQLNLNALQKQLMLSAIKEINSNNVGDNTSGPSVAEMSDRFIGNLPLSDDQIASLRQKFGTPGNLQQPLPAGVISSSNMPQSASAAGQMGGADAISEALRKNVPSIETDLQRQYDNLEKAKKQAALYAMMGQPGVGIANINAAKNFTPAAQSEMKQNADILQGYTKVVNAKGKIEQLLDQYNNILKDIPDSELSALRFSPKIGEKAIKTINPKIATLENIASNINSFLPSLKDLPAGAYRVGAELNLINKGGVDYTLPKAAQYQNNFVLKNFLNRAAQNQKYAQAWLNQHKTLQNGWTPMEIEPDINDLHQDTLQNQEYGKSVYSILSPQDRLKWAAFNKRLKGGGNAK